MQHDFYSEDVWVPVAVKGFGLDYEMCPLGYVRKVRPDRNGARLWLLPEDSSRGPVYRLAVQADRAEVAEMGRMDEMRATDAMTESLEAEVFAGDIVERFGGSAPIHCGWGRQLRRKALAENASLRGVTLDEAVLHRVEHGAEGVSVEALLDAAATRCPWATSTVGGDARGADPVLGY